MTKRKGKKRVITCPLFRYGGTRIGLSTRCRSVWLSRFGSAVWEILVFSDSSRVCRYGGKGKGERWKELDIPCR